MASDENIIENLTVLNRVNTGSDHRLIRGRFNFKTGIDRAKLVKSQTPKIDYVTLKARHEMFQLELHNKFSEIQVAENDIESYNNNIIAIVNQAANSIAKGKKCAKVDKMSQATKDMLKKRREMKQSATKYGTSNTLNSARPSERKCAKKLETITCKLYKRL